ncbi:Hypothetical protein SMAX5B_008709 [Scophthalmus maximus]|uniref:Uncharacterized protein n=1 Tax=Scophthalmus maximus TaxID=52904 RepID=A0A2U9CRK8_SCOMX|nr:Hypothetical protein SMAX5B_008709 [Scophthalmus maximus]
MLRIETRRLAVSFRGQDTLALGAKCEPLHDRAALFIRVLPDAVIDIIPPSL